jgi:formylglycine-generating enzyme required for sulfatase activity
MGMSGKKSYKIQIIVALIGVAGVLGIAVISDWDKIFKELDRGLERTAVDAEEPGSTPVLEEAAQERLLKQQEEQSRRQPKQGDVVTNSIGMKLVYIPAGSFMMGSPLSEKGRDDESVHIVKISKDFWIGQTEVTQGQYKSVMNTQPWSGENFVQEDANNPAVHVAWEDAAEFCTKLSKQEGKTYRLPTEAEWEYACRAGTTTRFSFGDSDSSLGDYAWFYNNAYKMGQQYAHRVGQKKPNPWGLYDMHGNVWEWCSNWYGKDYYSKSPSVDPKGPISGDSRSLRGGSWYLNEFLLRCSFRYRNPPNYRSAFVGFRVVCSQP